ncbi:hypothetical protein SEPCBS57363_000422 [Sporothrix epigloea]|uniref:Uncharacterized protein n=1 Tax=Sporothrix epigloea TaxID=1892477 RepID=A0ABP0D4Z4_9PEZI
MAPWLRMNTLVPQAERPPFKSTGNITVFTPHDTPYMPQQGHTMADGVSHGLHKDIQAIVTAYTIVAKEAPRAQPFATLFSGVPHRRFAKAVDAMSRMPKEWRFGLHHLHTQVCNAIVQYLAVNDRRVEARTLAKRANMLAFPAGMALIHPFAIPVDSPRPSAATINSHIVSCPAGIECKTGYGALCLYLEQLGHRITGRLFDICAFAVSQEMIDRFERDLILSDSAAEKAVRASSLKDIFQLECEIGWFASDVDCLEPVLRARAVEPIPEVIILIEDEEEKTTVEAEEVSAEDEKLCRDSLTPEIDEDGTWDDLAALFKFLDRKLKGKLPGAYDSSRRSGWITHRVTK